ncbi:hypothetical protein ABZ930_19265 [Streptomyces sp. NPDC046716]|uniref:hypothetical protein n=1 Tax=Streptomyces sp. NPDC046716 TaxID=3157093 RepID=UPI00340AFD48
MRWAPWLYWPMLVVSVALLASRIVDGARAGQIVIASGQVLVWVLLLINQRVVWLRHLRATESVPAQE